jgi:hypothetical protein
MFISSTELICCAAETNTSFVQHSLFPVPYSLHVVLNVARVIASMVFYSSREFILVIYFFCTQETAEDEQSVETKGTFDMVRFINAFLHRSTNIIGKKILFYGFVLRRYRDSVVGIVTGYGLDDRGGRISSPGRVKNFLFSTSSRPTPRSIQPPIQRVSGALSPGLKGPGREARHSPPSSADIKKIWI